MRITQESFSLSQVNFSSYCPANLIEANLAYISAQENRWTAGATIAGLVQGEIFP